LIFRQPGEGVFQQLPQLVSFDGLLRKLRAIPQMRIGLFLQVTEGFPRDTRTAFSMAQRIVAGVGDDAQQPRAERAAAKLREVAVRGDAGLLGGIIRRGGILQQMVCQVVGLSLIMQQQRIKRIQVPSLRGVHERRLVPGCGIG